MDPGSRSFRPVIDRWIRAIVVSSRFGSDYRRSWPDPERVFMSDGRAAAVERP